MCGPKHHEFWMSPAGLKTSYALLILNICGVLGWIAGSIYVSVDCGQNKNNCNNLWFWAMPFACHFWGIMGSIRCIRAHKMMNRTSEMQCQSMKCWFAQYNNLHIKLGGCKRWWTGQLRWPNIRNVNAMDKAWFAKYNISHIRIWGYKYTPPPNVVCYNCCLLLENKEMVNICHHILYLVCV